MIVFCSRISLVEGKEKWNFDCFSREMKEKHENLIGLYSGRLYGVDDLSWAKLSFRVSKRLDSISASDALFCLFTGAHVSLVFWFLGFVGFGGDSNIDADIRMNC